MFVEYDPDKQNVPLKVWLPDRSEIEDTAMLGTGCPSEV